MVRPDESAAEPGRDKERLSGCIFPAGASPAPRSAGAPGSRPRAEEASPLSQAECRKPGNQSRERASRPQHQVNPTASKKEQWKSQAAHVTGVGETHRSQVRSDTCGVPFQGRGSGMLARGGTEQERPVHPARVGAGCRGQAEGRRPNPAMEGGSPRGS